MNTQVRNLAIAAVAWPVLAAAQVDRYVDEYPLTVGISPAADALRLELQQEIGAMLAAGRLAPLRIHYADEHDRGYYLYTETLRDVITIGAAYPYLTPAQQQAARAFVRTQCLHAVWWSMIENPPTNGARREPYTTRDPLHGWANRFGTDVQLRPRVAGLTGLELYARNARDWALISNYWSNITDYYSRNDMWGGPQGYRGDLYGTLGAHVAMVRMAAMMGDHAQGSQALARLYEQISHHLDFASIVARSTNWYYSYFGDPRPAPLVFRGWLFLNITPEICRFISDHTALRTAALAHVDAGHHTYPLWWLHQAPYWTRWTGDEGMGLPSEMLGMIFPLERWVRRRPAAQLAAWLSAPAGRGDCYYIESLIAALEAHGTTVWTRHPHVPCAVLSPNGGEVAMTGGTWPVTWVLTSSITAVDLFFSSDDFATSSLIASNLANTGMYTWSVPDGLTTNARVRVQAAGSLALYDSSDEAFAIIPEARGAVVLMMAAAVARRMRRSSA